MSPVFVAENKSEQQLAVLPVGGKSSKSERLQGDTDEDTRPARYIERSISPDRWIYYISIRWEKKEKEKKHSGFFV